MCWNLLKWINITLAFHTGFEKKLKQRAVGVVRWSVSLPSTLTIRIRIQLATTYLFICSVLKKGVNKWKKCLFGPFKKFLNEPLLRKQVAQSAFWLKSVVQLVGYTPRCRLQFLLALATLSADSIWLNLPPALQITLRTNLASDYQLVTNYLKQTFFVS